MVKKVTSESAFKQALESASKQGQLVVVDFFAEWCGPCKVLAPKLEDMSKAHADVEFLKVDVDELEGLAAEYGISAMPTIVFFKGGKKVSEVVGANLSAIQKAIEANSKQLATA